jgi:hypothetical protein
MACSLLLGAAHDADARQIAATAQRRTEKKGMAALGTRHGAGVFHCDTPFEALFPPALAYLDEFLRCRKLPVSRALSSNG